MTTRSILWLLLALPLGACTDPTARLDADAGADMTVAPEELVTLNATAAGGVAPYTFRWNVTQQPTGATVDLTDHEMGETLTAGVLSISGSYQFRVRVTDATGASDASFVNVKVGGDLAVTASARDVLRAVGESTPLEVEFDASTTGLTDKRYQWAVVEGDATINDPGNREPELTLNAEETVKVRVIVNAKDADDADQEGIAVVSVVGVRDATPQVVIENSGAVSGEMVIELFGDEAPNTVANFLRYVDAGFYDGLIWHRVDGDFVIQTGAYERVDGVMVRQAGVRPTIDSEADNGRTNQRGAVGLALKDDDEDSGDSQFYVNLVDNFALDTGTPTYTVFGRVVEGLEEVVDAIAEVPVGSDSNGLTEVPVDDIVITSLRRIDVEIPTDGGSNGPLIELDVTAEADDPLRIIGESTQLRVTVADPPEGLLYSWTVVSGSASFDNATSTSPTVTITSADTVQLRVTVRGEGVKTATADAFVVGVENATPRVIIRNSGAVTGDIVLELLTAAAPGTVANFLRYVDDRFFDGIVWHRVDDDFVIQGGAFERTAEGLVARAGARPAISSEANNGESNIRGTVAMALRGTDANSGSNQFFVNLGDNSSLDNGSPPFTVFARVVEGMDVVDDIATVGVETDPLSGLNEVPVEDIVMTRVRRENDSAGGELASFSAPSATDLAERGYAAANLTVDLANEDAEIDDAVVIITGGLGANSGGGLESMATVSFYNPSTQTFSNSYTTPDGDGPHTFTLDTPRSHHMQVTAPDGKVIILGGMTGASGTSLGTATTAVEVFDPAAGTLTTTFPLINPRGRGHAATRMPQTRIVTSGDATWEVFDSANNSRFGPYQLLRTRLGHASVTVLAYKNVTTDNRALVIGGAGSGPDTMELLNPTDRTRTLLTSTLPRQLRELAAVNLDVDSNAVLIVGGIDMVSSNSVAGAYVLDVESDTLTTVDPLPERPGGAARQKIVMLGERYAVVLGGEEVVGEAATALDYYAIFDRETRAWVEHGKMRSPRAGLALTALDATSALIIGGATPSSPPSEMRDDAEVITLEVPDVGSNGI